MRWPPAYEEAGERPILEVLTKQSNEERDLEHHLRVISDLFVKCSH
jgi:hypothetical protein